MKNVCKYLQMVAMMVAASLFVACSDSDSYDPYANHSIRPFYPSAVAFSSLNSEEVQTDKSWKFTYNTDNTIKAYTYSSTIKNKKGVEVTENHKGELTYYTEPTGTSGILNQMVVTNSVSELMSTTGYCDTIVEDVKIVSGKIESIKTVTRRTYLDGTKKTDTSVRNFVYTDKYCTSSTLTDGSGATTTYSYTWGTAQLLKVVVYSQGENNSISQEVYEYTYNTNDLATDYKFNTLAFLYGNMPEIYAAMNLFGVTSAYKIESENYSGYRTIGNVQYDISPISREFSILESTNSVTYTADSPSTSSYFFTFSNQ